MTVTQAFDCYAEINARFGASTYPVVSMQALSVEELTVLEHLDSKVARRLGLPLFVYSLSVGMRAVVAGEGGVSLLTLSALDERVKELEKERDEVVSSKKGRARRDELTAQISHLVFSVQPVLEGARITADPLLQPLQFIHDYQPAVDSQSGAITASGSGIFVLLDFDSFLSGDRAIPEAQRWVKDLAFSLRQSRKRVILLSSQRPLPANFDDLIPHIESKLPDQAHIAECVQASFTDLQTALFHNGVDFVDEIAGDDEALARICRAAQGLACEEIQNVIQLAVYRQWFGGVTPVRFDASLIKAVSDAKVEKLSRLGVGFAEPADVAPGGMALWQQWVDRRKKLFWRDQESNLKLPTPKGALLTGVSGCGKSLLAKYLGSRWEIPVLKLDLSALYGGIVGATEENLRRVIAQVEACSPCVLLIDEVEKALSGATSDHQGDSGVSSRMVGNLLNWLQEKTKPIFVIATANDISVLQTKFPEMLRKGRFDEIFFVDVPNFEERQEIIKIHLASHGSVLSDAEVEELAIAAADFSGAEIGNAIAQATIAAFDAERDYLTLADIMTEAQGTVPLARAQAQTVARLRDWAITNAKPASAPSSPPTTSRPAPRSTGGSKAQGMILPNIDPELN